jgi:SAM-dependent methyltransferase
MSVDPLAVRAWGAAADHYERGRPGWPEGAVASVIDRFGAARVLDLAAGTGKLTRVLAEHADDVIAVEPLEGMRRQLEQHLPRVRVLTGTAEAIPLADGGVDAVFVAEAFHWFDLPRAVPEIARVLRPGGGLAVLWNRPQWDAFAWFDELWAVLRVHREAVTTTSSPDYERAPWREALDADSRFEPLEDEDATHEQTTDRERLLAMIDSFSWIGGLPDDRREPALAACRAVLERHGVDAVTLTYKTRITTTRRIDG